MFYKILFLSIGSLAIFAGDFTTDVSKLKLSQKEEIAFDIWKNNRNLAPHLAFFIGIYLEKKFNDDHQDDLLTLIKDLLAKVPAANESINNIKKLIIDMPELKEIQEQIKYGCSKNFFLQIGEIVLLSTDGSDLTLRTPSDRIFNYSLHRQKWLWQEVHDPQFQLIPTTIGKPRLMLRVGALVLPWEPNELAKRGGLDYLLRERQGIQ